MIQLIILVGRFNLHNFSASSLWSIIKGQTLFLVKENSSNCSAVAIGFLGPVVQHVYQRLGG